MRKPKKEEVILYSFGAVFALFITFIYGLLALTLLNYVSEFVVITVTTLPIASFVASRMVSYIFKRICK